MSPSTQRIRGSVGIATMTCPEVGSSAAEVGSSAAGQFRRVAPTDGAVILP
jgi:hypothetical protein